MDDEPDVISHHSALLVDAGCEVVAAKDGVEAMKRVRTDRPALVSLDITMPGKSGVRFHREMRKDPELAGIPIILVTGVANPWPGPSGGGSFQSFITSRRQVPPPAGYFENPVERESHLEKVAEILAR